jgi:hypothetical protein
MATSLTFPTVFGTSALKGHCGNSEHFRSFKLFFKHSQGFAQTKSTCPKAAPWSHWKKEANRTKKEIGTTSGGAL